MTPRRGSRDVSVPRDVGAQLSQAVDSLSDVHVFGCLSALDLASRVVSRVASEHSRGAGSEHRRRDRTGGASSGDRRRRQAAVGEVGRGRDLGREREKACARRMARRRRPTHGPASPSMTEDHSMASAHCAAAWLAMAMTELRHAADVAARVRAREVVHPPFVAPLVSSGDARTTPWKKQARVGQGKNASANKTEGEKTEKRREKPTSREIRAP